MKFEFSHDFIAKQVYDKSSAEAKARRKVESIVQRAHQRHLENNRILLTKEDIAEVKLFEEAIKFSEAEQSFIRKSQLAINRRRNFIIWVVTAAFIILSGLVIWARIEQRKAKVEQRYSQATALAAKSYERQIKGDNSSALRFAQYGYQTTDRDASRKALYNSFFQRNKYYYHKSVKGASNAIVSIDLITVDTPFLMTTSLNGDSRFWNLDLDPIQKDSFFHTSENIWISPNGKLLCTINDDGSLHLKDIESQTLIRDISNQGFIDHIYFSPVEENLVTVSRQGKAKIWNFKGELLDSIKSTSIIKSARFTPNGKHVVTLSPTKLQIWTSGGRYLDQISLANPHEIQFLPMPGNNQDCFAFGCIYSGTRLSFWETCLENDRITIEKLADLPEQARLLMDLDISNTGQLALLVNFDYVALYQIEYPKGQKLSFFPTGELKGHTGFINQVHFNPDGHQLYTISDDQTIKLWTISSVARPFEIILDEDFPEMNGQKITSIMESPRFVLNRGGGQEKNIWDIQNPITPQMLFTLESEDAMVISALDGQRLASLANDDDSGRKLIHILDNKGNPIAKGNRALSSVQKMHFLAGDHALLTFQDNDQIKFWGLDGQFLDSLKLNGNFSDVVPSPVDTNLIAVLSDRMQGKSMVGLYDLALDSLNLFVSTTELDTGGIVKFSPSGKYILSIHFDKIEIWNLEGKLIESIVSYDESFSDAFFAKEEQYLVAIDGNQAIIMDWTKAEKQIAKIDQVDQALFSEDMAYLFIINPLTNTLERWPFSPDYIIKQIETMGIADLDPEEKQRYGIKW